MKNRILVLLATLGVVGGLHLASPSPRAQANLICLDATTSMSPDGVICGPGLPH